MSNIIRIKRRLDDGFALSGAPTSLYNAEMAFNEVDNTLYYGRGDNGSGVATEVVAIGGNGYIETLVSNTSSAIMDTISENLSTVLGTDIGSLAQDLNSIKELADSLSGDAAFAVTVNDRINTLNQASGNLTPRVGALETALDTLTGASQVSVLGTIASQDSDDVSITGGTISVSTLTVTGDSSIAGLSASGALDVAGKASLKGAVDITGAVDMASTLDVSGKATLKGALDVDGAAALKGGLAVTGAASVSDALTVTGAATLNGGLTVTGAASVSDALTVTGLGTFQDNVSVAGTFEVGSGSATLFVEAGKVGINTETPSEALEVVGNGKFSGDVMGSGTSAITGFIMDGGLF